MGVPAEQVIQVTRSVMSQKDSKIPQLNLREIFHMTSHTRTEGTAILLEVRTKSGPTHVPVDEAEGTISLGLDQIKKLPPLIDLNKSHAALWGIAILKKETAFLVDLSGVSPA